MYALILLQITLSFCTMVLEQVKTSYLHHQENVLDFIELSAIQKVKKDLLDYKEEDEQYEDRGYLVNLRYDDITCYITITKNGELCVNSRLEFDDIEEVIVSYEYE